MTEGLLKELKLLDDKIILTEVYLLESRAAHAIQNLPRAKVSNPTSAGLIELTFSVVPYFRKDDSQLGLLPPASPSPAGHPSRRSQRRRQRLQNGLLLLLRGVRGLRASG
jgi:hypothetical protein